jgi:hypothetical protein
VNAGGDEDRGPLCRLREDPSGEAMTLYRLHKLLSFLLAGQTAMTEAVFSVALSPCSHMFLSSFNMPSIKRERGLGQVSCFLDRVIR